MMTREEAIEYLKRADATVGRETKTKTAEALELAIKALETLEEFEKAQIITGGRLNGRTYAYKCGLEDGKRKALEQEPRWIPVSERLPKELEPVNVTWINHNPESYYADIKDKPFTATGVYFNGQWYWWSTLCTDILAEYSHNYDDIIDDDIEITAWMPLPKPYEEKESEE